MKKKTTSKINELLKDLMAIEPLIEFEEPMSEPSHEMKYALAQMYANEGFRKYLINTWRIQINNAVMVAEDEVHAAFLKGRAVTIKELLGKAKGAFDSLEKVKDIQKRVELQKQLRNTPAVEV